MSICSGGLVNRKPTTDAGYERKYTDLVRATCLYLATKVGDITDDLIVIGGLVPSLLIDQENLSPGVDPHAGTLDLDVGLTLRLLDDGRYHTLTERLRRAGFEQDTSNHGNPTRQRWKIGLGEKITVDFLIPPSLPGDQGGGLRDIEPDFAAFIAPGLELAFQNRKSVNLTGKTIFGEQAMRAIWTCGPGAYVVLKALAFGDRGENKDAYDLFYVVRNYGTSVDDVAAPLRSLLHDPSAVKAMQVLERDFSEHNGIGPRRVAEFLTKRPDDEVQADVVGFVRQLLERCS